MIGTKALNILCVLYSAMLGFIWILVDSVYHIIKPRESSDENGSDKSRGKCDLNNSLLENSDNVEEHQEKNPSEAKSGLNLYYEKLPGIELRVNPEVDYLSKPKLISKTKGVPLKRRMVLKRPHEYIRGVPSNILTCTHEKSLNVMVVNQKHFLNNYLVFSIREITKFINRSILENSRVNHLVPMSHTHVDYNIKVTVPDSMIKNLNTGLISKRKKSNPFLLQPLEPIHGKRIKLDSDQIIALQKTAHYIINHLDIEVKSHFKTQFEEMEISDYLDIDTNEDYSGLRMKQKTKVKEPHVIITELDSTDEIEVPKKHKNQRKKKNKKKNRKGKLTNQIVESNSVTFSSKQCFERLAFFMSTNQGLTQSKMMLEIEKEFKPIKDQISELRESMTDFVVVNQRTNEKGVKTSRLSVQPIDRSGRRPKSILTVASSSLQRLARLADTSNNIQNVCPEVVESEPKKLSPLAEMYIKLSHQ